MRKVKRNDKGVTLIELVVSIAILALLMVAIIGVMNTNVVIFRKSKADLAVQSSAQDVYNNITDSIMQARAVTIEGYTYTGSSPDDKPTFVTTNIGKYVGGSVSPVKLKKESDIAKLDLSSQTDYTPFSHFKVYDGESETYSYTDIYLTKLEVEYTVPLDMNYVPEGADIDDEDAELKRDTCTVRYTFSENVMKLEIQYKYMTQLNVGTFDDDSRVYTNQLNYIRAGGTESDADSGTKLTGAVAQVDAENNSIAITLYFADKSMSYKTVGMVDIRNSYVLYDAK